MKKLLLPVVIAAFVCGTALAEGGAGKKGHDCPLAQGEKAAAAKEHDCPHAKVEKAAATKDHDCPHAKAKQAGHPCPDTIKGVESVTKNSENGVQITMTAKDKETAAKVQKSALAHYSSKERMCKDCAAKLEGAETKVTDTETGVIVEITGQTPELVKKIQDASLKGHSDKSVGGHKCAGCGKKGKAPAGKKAKTARKYLCPMKCAESGKPGKCPKCGMDLVEKK